MQILDFQVEKKNQKVWEEFTVPEYCLFPLEKAQILLSAQSPLSRNMCLPMTLTYDTCLAPVGLWVWNSRFKSQSMEFVF